MTSNNGAAISLLGCVSTAVAASAAQAGAHLPRPGGDGTLSFSDAPHAARGAGEITHRPVAHR